MSTRARTGNNLNLSQESVGSTDTAKPVKESPFSKTSMSKLLTESNSATKKARVQPVCNIITTFTESGKLTGFTLYCDHYAETSIFNPFYNRHLAQNRDYLTAIGAVPLVFEIKTVAAGMHGNELMKRTPSVAGGRLCNMKGMVVMTPLEDATEEMIVAWHNDTFIPALTRVDIEPHNIPVLQDPANWRHDDSWSETLTDRGWTALARMVGDLQEPRLSVQQLFKADRTNYTAVYPAGNAPTSFFQHYAMTAQDVYAADLPNVPVQPAPPALPAQPPRNQG